MFITKKGPVHLSTFVILESDLTDFFFLRACNQIAYAQLTLSKKLYTPPYWRCETG